MDKNTVLEIIDMLEVKINKLYYTDIPKFIKQEDKLFPHEYHELIGQMVGLNKFKESLEECLEVEEAKVDSVQDRLERGMKLLAEARKKERGG